MDRLSRFGHAGPGRPELLADGAANPGGHHPELDQLRHPPGGAEPLPVPRIVAARMVMNSLLDAGLGWIPVFGDLFDVYFKADTRNVASCKNTPGAGSSRAAPGGTGSLGGLIGLVILIVVFWCWGPWR